MIYDGEGRKKKNLLKKKSPEKDDKEEEIKSQPGKDECFSLVQGSIISSQGDTSAWVARQVRFNKLRMRIKKTKTFPFVGCSNLKMPTAEIKIKKLKAALSNVIFGLRPIVQAIPTPSGDFELADKVEKWLDYLIMDKMNFKPKGIISIDQSLELGFFLMKPYWRFEVNTRTEEWCLDDISQEEAMFLFDGNTSIDDVIGYLINKYEVDLGDKVYMDNMKNLEEVAMGILSAKDEIEFTIQDILYNAPDVSLVSPEKCYVPSTTGFDPQKASFICHEFEMTMEDLKMCAEYKGWDIEGVKGVQSYLNYDVNGQKDLQSDLREGINRLNGPDNLVKIWEWYGYYDIDGDGKKEKACITVAPDFSKVMRKIGLPFNNGKWPFVKLFYELTQDRWFSHRGVVEIAEDLIKEIDIQHNMKIDMQTVRNAPMFVYRAGMVNPNLIQMTPNQAIPVRGGQPLNDSISVLNAHNPNVEFSYEREQMLLEARVEELIGQIDYTLQSMINKRQPRTLGEVELQQQSANSIFALDADQYRMQFSELFNFIWDLWCQYGNDEEEFNYFGQDGWEKIRLTREEVQGKYRIIVKGNDQNTNPNVKMQKAQQILLGVTNQVLLQMGVVKAPQVINGLKRYYQALDIDGWEQLIDPSAVQPPPPPQPPPVATFIKPKFSDLSEGEQAQVLAGVGIEPDIHGRALNKQVELTDKSIEMLGGMNAR